ncbi:MAG: fibronectin type III domain-containing protein [Terracidiphilus sp.]
MKSVQPLKFFPLLLIAVLSVFPTLPMRAQDVDLTPQYQWKPVQIGAGGWMRGMAVSPSDPTRRYARGDVDEVYRWDNTAQQWFPTKVSGSLPAAYGGAPVNGGGGAIAIDPQNPDHVLVVFTLSGSADLNNFWGLNVFYSTNGAMTYQAANLNLSGNLSGETTGERMVIDPNNGNLAYLGPPGAGAGKGNPDGLQRSLDGGATWAQVTGGGLPVSTASIRYEFQLPRIDGGSGTASVGGQTASRIVYVTYITHNETNSDAVIGGGVLKSADGGNTWTEITGTILGSGASTAGFATMDNFGNLWVADANNNNLYRYTRAGTAWTRSTAPYGGGRGIAVDPGNPQRIFATGDSSMARSLNGGASWTDLGPLQFSSTQTIEWLRPSLFRPQGHYISVSGLYMDPAGILWINCGNDGIMTNTPNDATDSIANPPIWTSASEGIEEAVAEPSVIPPGGNPVLTVEDEALFSISDPDTYTAQHFPINLWNGSDGLSDATDSSYAPNQPKYVVELSDNISEGNPLAQSSEYSGYSSDGGDTWQLFPSIAAGTHPCILYLGSIAVSARPAGHENDAPGADNLVWIPSNDNDFAVIAQGPAPFYSKDGGATWTQTASFNTAPGATQRTECPSSTSYTYMGYQWGPWTLTLSQHLLVADPVTPGAFYVDMTAGGFWKSTDGGVTWTQETAANAPGFPHHGTLATVPGVSGDMWLVDGHEGATTHGLFHTLDGGNTFARSPVFDYAWTLALGKPAPGQSYPAIYVDGRYHGDSNWGIFQSIDGGATFNRIAYYPYGILDVPNTMTASWDVFGTVYIGFEGNTFYYGAYDDTAGLPGAPTLTATAGDTVANLRWSPGTGGTPTGFDLYRGTASGQEPATPVATFDGTTYSYQDTGLSDGTTYYYYLTASNGIGAGPKSNEATAALAQPSISLGAANSGSLSATVNVGVPAVFNLALTAVNYAGTVTYSCTGAPAGDACTSAPPTVTLAPGTTSTPVAITVQTSAATAMLAGENRQLLGFLLWPVGLLAMPLLLRRGRLRGVAAVLLTAALLAAMTSCGSSSQPAASTFTLTVTATGTGGVAPATATLTLTVQQ